MLNKFLKIFVRLSFICILILSFSSVKDVYASTTFKTCTVNEKSYLRSTPGGTPLTDVDGDMVGVKSPARLEVLEEIDGYKKVRGNYYSNNYVGWVANKFLTDIRTYTTDDNYTNSLRNLGFPEDYIIPLAKLHAIHPNWTFKPSKNGSGLSFESVINGESDPVYKNLIDSPYTTLRSTEGAAYSNGSYVQFEPRWYAASRQTISFYVDPRNWLNENTIFMFEQLSYDSNIHTESAVDGFLKGTFLNGYAKSFVSAGKNSGVSPIALAIRVIQEQGVSGSMTAKMVYNGKTYYNYFNIGATGNTVDEIYSNALNKAVSKNWTTPEASIQSGAELIGKNYVLVGQDTNYYQKFNTINNNSLYINQYMTNVRVLPSESYNTYTTYYKYGKLDSNFVFKIPVYTNMPSSTSLSISGNGDNSLKSLTVSSCNLNPAFDSGITSYTCNVGSNVNSVKVTATSATTYSTVSGNGTYSLKSGSTIIDIIVTAANGNIKTYKVTINKTSATKGSGADIISSIGLNNNNNVITGFRVGMDVSEIINDIKSKYPSATVSFMNNDGKKITTGKIATGMTFNISNVDNQNYKVVIKGDTSGDGIISSIDYSRIRSYILDQYNLSDVYKQAADLNNDGIVSSMDYSRVRGSILQTYTIIQ